MTHIPVTIEKSHLITIGERLYTEKSSFLRELVNNAFDADASRVDVAITSDCITIQDNGSGMDEAGMTQYFTIGSSLKKEENQSPIHHRVRIGEFGIGKFAALSACDCFEIETWKNGFHGKLIFDKAKWSSHDAWRLELQMLPLLENAHGTKITLHKPSIIFAVGKVRRYLAERTPIHAPDFSIYLNQERVTSDLAVGERLPIHIQTPYGLIEGVIIIAPSNRKQQNFGIAVRVKGVLIRHEGFGMETSHRTGITRITGYVQASFLPVTSSRDDFLRDTEEFCAFNEMMRRECKRACDLIKDERDRLADIQSSRVLKDALTKIGRAMRRHGRLFPETSVPLGENPCAHSPTGEGFDITQAEFLDSREELPPEMKQRLQETRLKKGQRNRPHIILGKRSVMRSLRIGSMAIAVRLEHLGNEESSLVSGGIIYINVDHPLYCTYQNQDELLTIHVARVITKELALQAGITEASQAFTLQDELLTDALRT